MKLNEGYKFKEIIFMKRFMYVVGVLSFLFIGAVSIDSVLADQAYDDPPKKEVKSKDCSKTCKAAKTCGSSKKDYSKKEECHDKEDAKSAKVTNNNTSNTKKEDPDKK
jgi:hypothetical protein